MPFEAINLPADLFTHFSSASVLYLSEVRIENFGRIIDGTFSFHQGVNLMIEEGSAPFRGGKSKGKHLLTAIEILLWPVLDRDKEIPEPRKISRNSPPARITGDFRERDKEGDEGCFQVQICATEEEGEWIFTCDGAPTRAAKLRSLFAQRGLHGASTIFLPGRPVLRGSYLPMRFLYRDMHCEATHWKIRKYIAALRLRTLSLADLEDLIGIMDRRCERMKNTAGRITDSIARNSEAMKRWAQLSSFANHSRMRKLLSKAGELRQEIEAQRAEIQRAESTARRRTEAIERLMAKLAIDTTAFCESDSLKIGKITLERTVEKLRQELNMKRNALQTFETAPDFIEALSDRKRALAAETESNRSQLLLNQKLLTSMEADKRMIAARLKVIKDRRLNEDCIKHASENLTLRTSLSENIYMEMNTARERADEDLAESRRRLDEILLKKTEVENKLKMREQQLFGLVQSEMMKERAGDQMTSLLLSGELYDTLEADVVDTLNRKHLTVISAMTSILREFGVGTTGTEWRDFGYFGAVIDHVHVEPQHRGLLAPLQKLLATFLVRDLEVAWRLRDRIQRLKFDGCVDFICFENYDCLPPNSRIPTGTIPLSSYLDTKKIHRYTLTPAEVEKLDEIIASELSNYLVVEGEPAVASNLARTLSKSGRWESYTFVTKDGTCFGREVERSSGAKTDALSAYNLLWDYWTSKQAEVKSRFDEMIQARKERMGVQTEVSAFLDDIHDTLRKITSLQAEIQFYGAAKKRLDRETEALAARIESMTEQAIALQIIERSGAPDALESELEARLERLESRISLLEEEMESLNSANASSIIEMVNIMIRLATGDEKNEKIVRLHEEVALLEVQTKEAENFLSEYAQLETEDGRQESLGHEIARELPWSAPKTPLYQSRIFLLEQKLAEIQNEIQENGELTAPKDWRPDVDYAQQLQIAEMEMRRETIPPVEMPLRLELQEVAAGAPREAHDSTVPVDLWRQILDVSQESLLLPNLDQLALKGVLKVLENTVREFHPQSKVWISTPEEQLSRIRGRGLESNTPINKREFVEVTFDAETTEAEAGQPLSKEQTFLLLISTLIARKKIHIPRMFFVDDSELPLGSLPTSLRGKFFDEFSPGCQMFIVSYDPTFDLNPVDNLLEVETVTNIPTQQPTASIPITEETSIPQTTPSSPELLRAGRASRSS